MMNVNLIHFGTLLK